MLFEHGLSLSGASLSQLSLWRSTLGHFFDRFGSFYRLFFFWPFFFFGPSFFLAFLVFFGTFFFYLFFRFFFGSSFLIITSSSELQSNKNCDPKDTKDTLWTVFQICINMADTPQKREKNTSLHQIIFSKQPSLDKGPGVSILRY